MSHIKPPYEGWDMSTCPVCDKSFFYGYHHPADQKLNHHMQDVQFKKKEHLDTFSAMTWPLNGGNIYWWEKDWYP